jgi:ABC-type amino acid transport substrate-binding protein
MKKLFMLLIAVLLTLSLGACGGNGAAGAANTGGGQNTAAEPKTLTIGIANGIAKISWIDEAGNWQGYNYEWLVKVDELLPQYVFKYEPITDFAVAFTGLDVKKFDFLAVHASWTAEREEKYLYANASTWESTGYTLKIPKGSAVRVNSDADLGGLTIAISPGTSVASYAEKFNETHSDNPINIVWHSGTVEQLLADLQSGAFDGTFGDPINDLALKEAYGDVFDVTGKNLFYDPAQKNGTYLLYNYGNEGLRDEIDGAITQLLNDGTLGRLSAELIGLDVTLKP